MQNNMKDRLVELLKDTFHEWECEVQPETVLQIAEHLVENGVVPVIRCCDCKHRQENPDINNTCYLTCNKIYGIQGTIEPDDYCSYGTPKERGREK